MTPMEFMALGLAPNEEVHVTLGSPGGKPRRVRLFFRGYRNGAGRTVARGISDLRPVFSPPSSRGGSNKKYYRACDTGFDNIVKIEK